MIYTIDQIRKIVTPIAASYGIQSLSLFGSYARGDASDLSDVDLLLDYGSIKSGFIIGGLYSDLKNGLKKDLDLVSTRGVNQDFLNMIMKDGVLLYKKEKCEERI